VLNQIYFNGILSQYLSWCDKKFMFLLLNVQFSRKPGGLRNGVIGNRQNMLFFAITESRLSMKDWCYLFRPRNSLLYIRLRWFLTLKISLKLFGVDM
jgi:hypothetical protein